MLRISVACGLVGEMPLDVRDQFRIQGWRRSLFGGWWFGRVKVHTEAVRLPDAPFEIRFRLRRRRWSGEKIANIVQQIEQRVFRLRARRRDHLVEGSERFRSGLFGQCK